MFVSNTTKMAHISLKKVPDDIHRDIKRLQLHLEEIGQKKSLEDIYIDLIIKGLEQTKQNPTK
jgi:hypothetical protein